MAKAQGNQHESLVELLNTLNSSTLTVSNKIPLIRHEKVYIHNTFLLNLLAFLQIPDELTENLLKKSGVTCADIRTVRFASLAAQKFISDVIAEARHVQENRYLAPQKHQQAEGLFARDKKTVLITEDLTAALQQV